MNESAYESVRKVLTVLTATKDSKSAVSAVDLNYMIGLLEATLRPFEQEPEVVTRAGIKWWQRFLP